MRQRFASIAHSDKWAYAYDSSYRYDGASRGMSQHLRMYETYGDGLTAHSGDWAVQIDQITDCLCSLAAAMQTDEELRNAAHYEIRAGVPHRESLDFAKSVKWVDTDCKKLMLPE